MLKYLSKSKLWGILLFIVTPIAAIMDVGIAFVMKEIVDIGLSKDLEAFKRIILVAIVYVLFKTIIDYGNRYIRGNVLKIATTSLKDDLMKSILKQDIERFNRQNSADYISILTNDTKMFEKEYFFNICYSYYEIISFLVSTIAIIVINPILAVLIFGLGSIQLMIPIVFGKNIESKKEKYSNSLGEYTAEIKDIFSGFEVIKTFRVGEKILALHKKKNMKVEQSKFNSTLFNRFINTIAFQFGEWMYLGTLLISSYLVIKGHTSVGVILAASQLMVFISYPLTEITEIITEFKSSNAYKKKFDQILEGDMEEYESETPLEFHHRITLSDVCFKYNEDRDILKDINLTFEKSKKYVIVGTSGSGKSTLIKILLKFNKDYKGDVLLDDQNYKDISTNRLYDLIGVNGQDIFMFDDTILNNIGLYGDYTQEEIVYSAEQAGLEKLMGKLPNGYKTEVGENALTLSGGEKQRIAIARTLLKKTPILILDESTSSLDNETAHAIEDTVLNIEGLTSIIITHKLNDNILNRADQIIVMDNGEVRECGTFSELMDKKEIFYSLYMLR